MDWLINQVKDNPSILISAYAALISTIALVWNIINSILDKMPRISVKAGFHSTMLVGEGDLVRGPELLEISIVNETKRIKYIKVPQLELDYDHGLSLGQDKSNVLNLYLKNSKLSYPLEIKSESEIIIKYPFSEESTWICEKAKASSKFRVVINDTIGKRYKSKSLRVKQLKNCIDHNSKIDPRLMSEMIINN